MLAVKAGSVPVAPDDLGVKQQAGFVQAGVGTGVGAGVHGVGPLQCARKTKVIICPQVPIPELSDTLIPVFGGVDPDDVTREPLTPPTVAVLCVNEIWHVS